VSGVQLLRVRNDSGGGPTESCRIAIGTRDGWYVTRNEQRCRGGPEGMSTVATTALSLEWIEGTSDPTFVLTTRQREERGEWVESGEGEYHPVTGGYVLELARFCSAPASSPPRCSADYIIGCHNADYPDKWRTAAWSFENGSGVISFRRKMECNAGRSLGDEVRD
jgi:hypothetical protein